MFNNNSIYKLTALWAFSECSLGGLMHLFKIPFTGFFVGGFATIIIGLIAFLRKQNFKTILQATILVILVKAAVSPQSPPAAYFAVFFQGFIGAIIFSALGFNKFSTILFAALAMVESSCQMVISKTIFYGMDFWKAIDLFFNNIIKDFGLNGHFSFSFWLIFSYMLIYAIWGVILGYFTSNLPQKLTAKWLLIKQQIIGISNTNLNSNKKTFSKFKWLGVVFTVVFIITILLLNGEQKWHALFIILRTLVVILVLYFGVAPLTNFLLKKLALGKQNQINQIVNELPIINQKAQKAYFLASKTKTGISKYYEFMWILITLTLFDEI